ncbi:response regulator transcription factor [Aquisediminimonas profunda]|uniref:response regulator transcription factor n=1 Tax=Aquisediminimonas profunda TaxID=1550733 RepID=UPI001C627D6E|nr:response regulator transcription factor [Aquisediminimonas profunda]
MRILLVEDDSEISRRLMSRLAAAGFVVEHAPDAETALDWPDPQKFTTLVVDLGLPGMSGIELISKWRERGLTNPILILSARGSWQDKVEGLNAGGDDFVVKPVRAEELIARLHALSRRAMGHTGARIVAGGITLDPAAKSVWKGDELLDLTQMEYRLLRMFMLRAGHIIAQPDILDHLYPMDSERDLNTIEVHVGRLRRKIGKSAITTIRGLGYRFER